MLFQYHGFLTIYEVIPCTDALHLLFTWIDKIGKLTTTAQSMWRTI